MEGYYPICLLGNLLGNLLGSLFGSLFGNLHGNLHGNLPHRIVNCPRTVTSPIGTKYSSMRQSIFHQQALISMESDGIIREITGMKRNMPYPSDGILEIISKDDGRLFDMF